MQPTQNTLNAASLSPRMPVKIKVDAEQAVGKTQRSTAPALMGIWRLGQPLHSGAYSRLFTAQPADAEGSPRFDYVLRTVATSREAREASLAQIVRFADAAAGTSHPNLIVVLDASLHSSHPFLIMPRLSGATVADLLNGPVVQPLPVILWIVRQAAQGLAALHLASWMHGDVKPENLFVGLHGHVTLLDLGFSRQVGTRIDREFLGTPQYTAPELVGNGEIIASGASDVFALGRLLLKLLTWTGPTVRNLESLDAVAELVSEMIATDPLDRPIAKDVASRLLRLEIETLGEHIQPPSTSLRRAG